MELYVKSEINGKFIKVTTIFESTIDANKFLEKNPDQGVIYSEDEEGEVVFCADLNDVGICALFRL